MCLILNIILFIETLVLILSYHAMSADNSQIRSLHAHIGDSPELNMKSCGYVKNKAKFQVQARVIEGDLAEIGEFPWQASVNNRLLPEDQRHLCDAVLIHRYWVLTVKHCIYPSNGMSLTPELMTITLGTIDMRNPLTSYNVSYIREHPLYDLALLRLSKEVYPILTDDKTSYRINFICLPNNMAINDLKEKAIITGFGSVMSSDYPKNIYLRKATIEIDSQSVCKTRNYSSFFICGVEKQHMTCFGDDGSGLVQYDGNRALLIGLIIGQKSDKPSEDRCGPGIQEFLRISYFIKFLKYNFVNDFMDPYGGLNKKDKILIKIDADLNNKTCGQKSSGNATQDRDTTQHQFPWMASIHYEDKKRTDTFVCGGALIRSNWVLTAKHCIEGLDPKILRVYLGSDEKNKYRNKYEVSIYILNPIWDLALIQFKSSALPVSESNRLIINYICLPKAKILNSAKEEAILSTFVEKNSKNIMNTKLEIKPYIECLSMDYTLQDVCVTKPQQMKCFNEVGNALFQIEDNRAVIIGISVGQKLLTKDKCGAGVLLFERISYFIDWLLLYIDEDMISPEEMGIDNRQQSPEYQHLNSFDKKGLNFVLILISILFIIYNIFQ